jgi:hypothetical protein
MVSALVWVMVIDPERDPSAAVNAVSTPDAMVP